MVDAAEEIAKRLNGKTPTRATKVVEEVEEIDEDAPDQTDAVEVDDEDIPDQTETDEEVVEDEDEEFSEKAKEIISKNRKEAREAKKRADKLQRELEAVKAGEAVEKEGPDFKGLYTTTAAKSALSNAGLIANPERALRLLNLSEVEFDEDNNIIGLDEEIEDLKEEFPELFEEKRVRTRAPKVDGAPRGAAKPKPKNSAEVLANRLG